MWSTSSNLQEAHSFPRKMYHGSSSQPSSCVGTGLQRHAPRRRRAEQFFRRSLSTCTKHEVTQQQIVSSLRRSSVWGILPSRRGSGGWNWRDEKAGLVGELRVRGRREHEDTGVLTRSVAPPSKEYPCKRIQDRRNNNDCRGDISRTPPCVPSCAFDEHWRFVATNTRKWIAHEVSSFFRRKQRDFGI